MSNTNHDEIERLERELHALKIQEAGEHSTLTASSAKPGAWMLPAAIVAAALILGGAIISKGKDVPQVAAAPVVSQAAGAAAPTTPPVQNVTFGATPVL